MRSILMIVTALCLIGCGKLDKEEGNSASTAHTEGTSVLMPPSEELKAQGYNDKYVKVRNTEKPDYNAYRQQWKRVNKDVLHEGYELIDPPSEIKETSNQTVVMDLDDLSFNHAFHMQYCAKGEGHTFWWRGDEYTTNLLNNEIKDSDYPSVDEE